MPTRQDDRATKISRPVSFRPRGGWKTKTLCFSWFVPCAGASSSFAGATSVDRSIVRAAVTWAARARAEPPTHATNAARKDVSITVTMFGTGGAAAKRRSAPA